MKNLKRGALLTTALMMVLSCFMIVGAKDVDAAKKYRPAPPAYLMCKETKKVKWVWDEYTQIWVTNQKKNVPLYVKKNKGYKNRTLRYKVELWKFDLTSGNLVGSKPVCKKNVTVKKGKMSKKVTLNKPKDTNKPYIALLKVRKSGGVVSEFVFVSSDLL